MIASPDTDLDFKTTHKAVLEAIGCETGFDRRKHSRHELDLAE